MGYSIPIYAMTAHHDRQHSELCHDVGMNGFLTKPVDADTIDSLCQEVAAKLIDAQEKDSTHQIQRPPGSQPSS
jgi:CheY-like chemotaxis protein